MEEFPMTTFFLSITSRKRGLESVRASDICEGLATKHGAGEESEPAARIAQKTGRKKAIL
jgi:hypothetical protein